MAGLGLVMNSQPRSKVLCMSTPADSRGKADTLAALAIGSVLVVLCIWFVVGPRSAHVPVQTAGIVSPEDIAVGPVRQPLGDPPVVMINSFNRTCMDCHRLFPSPTATQQRLRQHDNIMLNHGLNDRCLNCHDNVNRDKLVLHDGTTVGYGRSELLCAQCHGTTYRQWQRGGHGQSIGYWDTRLGPKRRFACAECHDPHAPAFEPYVPLPGPDTLRMGDQDGHGFAADAASSANPLRRRGQDKH